MARNPPPRCVDCGESPILGTYYSCKDARVCQICLQENHGHDLDDYDQCSSIQGEDFSHAVANSYHELVSILLGGKSVREIDFYITTSSTTPPPNPAFLRLLLLRNSTLKSLQIFVRGSTHLCATVLALVEALKSSPSIVLLRFSICATQPQTPNALVAPALKELLETNHQLRYFYYRSISRYPLDGMRDDHVADHLFQGLVQSSLYRFYYDGHSPTGETNKRKAIQAIQSNPRLRSIETSFDQSDSQLDIAICDRNRQWRKRWIDVDATAEKQLQVMDEIRQADFEDKLSAYYMYLLESPSIILQSVRGNGTS
jgi:hypothetical protein